MVPPSGGVARCQRTGYAPGMQPETIGVLVDAAIPIAGGTYVTLLAHRKVGSKPGESPKMDAWHDRFGTAMKVVGPLCVVFALVIASADLLR